ncbi:3H domain protein [Caldicellulosiruptor hydrothermalis 108]|uniref:3H domain protein n=1 Tax=Caldicellulosiruptor hydrothermalis (strain DSM 18901 / VKM B-2411 / 108) TaxID=632292 RepID=E4Q7X1_CALH1|nr:transcription repressor NadR [Caldicellulosiruptor hydrothermalis]ADQ07889.1 3H domain protein [Caldicellulosiruptor hydrothermalis 108]
MRTEERRNKIIEILKNAKKAISGTELAKLFGVTRQVIVQDIAILRAKGIKILSAPQGYIIDHTKENSIKRVFAVKHECERTEEELNLIVDNGGKVLDVIVEHPLYGELRGLLMLSSRYDVSKFMEFVKEGKAKLLSSLTGGVHLHTVEADSEEVLNRIQKILKEKGFLME